jgi:hypothetical protein
VPCYKNGVRTSFSESVEARSLLNRCSSSRTSRGVAAGTFKQPPRFPDQGSFVLCDDLVIAGFIVCCIATVLFEVFFFGFMVFGVVVIACQVFIKALLFCILLFFFLFFFFGLFVVFAGVLAGTVTAVAGRLANGFLGSKGDALGFFAGAHGFVGLEGGDVFGELGGDLEAIEKKAGAAVIHIGRVEGSEDLSEGDLDAADVFDGEDSQFVGIGRIAVTVKVLVVVAIGLVAQGRGMAFSTAGHDVSAFAVHGSFSWDTPTPSLGGSSVFSAGYVKRFDARVFLAKELCAESSQHWT